MLVPVVKGGASTSEWWFTGEELDEFPEDLMGLACQEITSEAATGD